MNDWTADLIASYHSRGVLVDTNILLLFFVGCFERQLVRGFKRTDQFTCQDYDLLVRLLKPFHRIVTTPNILTEVNGFSNQIKEPAKTRYFADFARQITVLDEKYVVSTDATATEQFPRLGLTDAGIMHLAAGNYLVLTDDFTLEQLLAKAGIDVLNFNHLRRLPP
jgi:rRNA-processing protein FCF1